MAESYRASQLMELVYNDQLVGYRIRTKVYPQGRLVSIVDVSLDALQKLGIIVPIIRSNVNPPLILYKSASGDLVTAEEKNEFKVKDISSRPNSITSLFKNFFNGGVHAGELNKWSSIDAWGIIRHNN